MCFTFSRARLASEEIVADLVHCFLLPEVRKTTARDKGAAILGRCLVFVIFWGFFPGARCSSAVRAFGKGVLVRALGKGVR